jgi:8-oxo-dGTP pyrophosphatase MutT (NUDIX family)
VAALYGAVGFLYHPASRQVLLHHRDANAARYANVWAGFGGMCEPEDGVDPVATWRRELREEIGIELAPDRVRPLRAYLNPDTGRTRHVFYAEWPSLDQDFVLTEGDGYAWFPLDEAIELPDLTELARGDLLFLRGIVGSAASAAATSTDVAPGTRGSRSPPGGGQQDGGPDTGPDLRQEPA